MTFVDYGASMIAHFPFLAHQQLVQAQYTLLTMFLLIAGFPLYGHSQTHILMTIVLTKTFLLQTNAPYWGVVIMQ